MIDRGPLTAMEFASVARMLGAEAMRLGFDVPTIRTPVRSPHVRSVRPSPTGKGWVLAVRYRDRPRSHVVGDIVDGIAHVYTMTHMDPPTWQMLQSLTLYAMELLESGDYCLHIPTMERRVGLGATLGLARMPRAGQ